MSFYPSDLIVELDLIDLVHHVARDGRVMGVAQHADPEHERDQGVGRSHSYSVDEDVARDGATRFCTHLEIGDDLPEEGEAGIVLRAHLVGLL